MRNTTIKPLSNYAKSSLKSREENGDFIIDNIASDKSISHRSVIFAFLSAGQGRIKNYLFGEDTLNTLKIAIKLGLSVESNIDIVKILQYGKLPSEACSTNGIESKNIELLVKPHKDGILEPDGILDCGNAGTAIRLYMGLLAGRVGHFVLSGDKYLRSRPMGRVINPLNAIGADITARSGNTLAPISINGRALRAFKYHNEISSAQVKSAMILAALRADDKSEFSEISPSRDHTERMLRGMGANIAESKMESNMESSKDKLTITPLESALNPLDIEIPADPSSAFYFALLAAIAPEIKVRLKNVLLNKTRIEAFRVLEKMGVKISIELRDSKYEEVGDICVSGGELRGVEVDSNISWLIDEIPALAIAFACAKGQSSVRNAKELRFKESDRIKATLEGLAAFGVEFSELDDGFIINGGLKPNGVAKINSYGDHRIAMSFAILGALCEVEVQDSACIDVSFPNFLEILERFCSVESRMI